MESLENIIGDFSDLIGNILEETVNRSDFSDLTQKQLYYLKVIVRMKNPTVTMLARELCLSKPTVTVLLDKLEEKGYIIRFRSEEDRRVVYIQADKKGERINALMKIAYEKAAEKVKSALSKDEIIFFTGLLQKIAGHSK